jgi:hypothetical protein
MKPNHQECAMAVQEDDLDLDIDAEAGDGQGGRKKIILIVGAAILVLLLVSGGLTFWLLGGFQHGPRRDTWRDGGR